MVALALVGLGVASYLTYVHYAGIHPACTAGQSCIKVQTSQWSRLDGVPVALIGLLGYVAILATLLAPDREQFRLATLALTIVGLGFSAYLTYRELFSIHAICEWCVSSAVIMALLMVAAAVRYVVGDDHAQRDDHARSATRGAPRRPDAASGSETHRLAGRERTP
jgi:uncharacterized membrane protein